MSRESDQSTRKQMRVGIRGENVLPPLDVFTVTATKPAMVNPVWEAWDEYMKHRNEMYSKDIAAL